MRTVERKILRRTCAVQRSLHDAPGVRRSRPVAALLLICLLTAPICATTLKVVPPESVGMSAKHLAHIDGAVAQSIERGETPGAVVLVARRGGGVGGGGVGGGARGGPGGGG